MNKLHTYLPHVMIGTLDYLYSLPEDHLAQRNAGICRGAIHEMLRHILNGVDKEDIINTAPLRALFSRGKFAMYDSAALDALEEDIFSAPSDKTFLLGLPDNVGPITDDGQLQDDDSAASRDSVIEKLAKAIAWPVEYLLKDHRIYPSLDGLNAFPAEAIRVYGELGNHADRLEIHNVRLRSTSNAEHDGAVVIEAGNATFYSYSDEFTPTGTLVLNVMVNLDSATVSDLRNGVVITEFPLGVTVDTRDYPEHGEILATMTYMHTTPNGVSLFTDVPVLRHKPSSSVMLAGDYNRFADYAATIYVTNGDAIVLSIHPEPKDAIKELSLITTCRRIGDTVVDRNVVCAVIKG